MQQVRGAMVPHGIFSPLGNYIGLHTVAHTHVPFVDTSIVDNQPFQGATCILDLEDAHGSHDFATITYLTTALGIERSGIKYHQGFLWRADAINLSTIYDQANNLTATSDPLVTSKLGWSNTIKHFGKGYVIPSKRESACRPATLLLQLHSSLKSWDVHGEAMLCCHLLR